MTWFHWLLIVLFALDALLRIALIGTARRPLTPTDAMSSVCVNGLLIWGVVTYA